MASFGWAFSLLHIAFLGWVLPVEAKTGPAKVGLNIAPKASGLAFCFVAPDDFFCTKDESRRSITCTAKVKPLAQMTFSLSKEGTMPNASAGLAALNWLEAMEEKPHFKLISKGQRVIDQRRAIMQTITYHELGNPDLPVRVRAAHVVVKEQLFTAELHCMSRACDSHLRAMEHSLSSLKWNCGDMREAGKDTLGLGQGIDFESGFGTMDSLIQQVKEFGLGNNNRKKS
jgi:hypothetical protein